MHQVLVLDLSREDVCLEESGKESVVAVRMLKRERLVFLNGTVAAETAVKREARLARCHVRDGAGRAAESEGRGEANQARRIANEERGPPAGVEDLKNRNRI
jgi:hypothetical protein